MRTTNGTGSRLVDTRPRHVRFNSATPAIISGRAAWTSCPYQDDRTRLPRPLTPEGGRLSTPCPDPPRRHAVGHSLKNECPPPPSRSVTRRQPVRKCQGDLSSPWPGPRYSRPANGHRNVLWIRRLPETDEKGPHLSADWRALRTWVRLEYGRRLGGTQGRFHGGLVRTVLRADSAARTCCSLRALGLLGLTRVLRRSEGGVTLAFCII